MGRVVKVIVNNPSDRIYFSNLDIKRPTHVALSSLGFVYDFINIKDSYDIKYKGVTTTSSKPPVQTVVRRGHFTILELHQLTNNSLEVKGREIVIKNFESATSLTTGKTYTKLPFADIIERFQGVVVSMDCIDRRSSYEQDGGRLKQSASMRTVYFGNDAESRKFFNYMPERLDYIPVSPSCNSFKLDLLDMKGDPMEFQSPVNAEFFFMVED